MQVPVTRYTDNQKEPENVLLNFISPIFGPNYGRKSIKVVKLLASVPLVKRKARSVLIEMYVDFISMSRLSIDRILSRISKNLNREIQ